MDPCSIAVLGGVFVGWALRGGTPASRLASALGKEQAAKLVRLLELLEAPDDMTARHRGRDEIRDELAEGHAE